MEVLHYLSGVMDFPYYEDHLEIDAVALLALAILILVHRLAAVRAHVLEHLELQLGVGNSGWWLLTTVAGLFPANPPLFLTTSSRPSYCPLLS